MTKEERKKLSQEAFKSPAFRVRMLNDPKAAAAELGIALGDDEVASMLAVKEEIRAHGRKIDVALASKAKSDWKQLWDSGELNAAVDGIWSP